jgi:mono/diheme cytochrome c family protein
MRSCRFFRLWSVSGPAGGLLAGLSITGFLLLIGGGRSLTTAQETKPPGTVASTSGNAALVARGKYIVTAVAACGDCHTPREPNGELDDSRWLAGAPVPYLSARPDADWPIIAPRIAGLPPANDAQMITLLTTGIWVDGKPLRSPMPRFQMTRADAEAVLAYLKSLSLGRNASQ